MRRPSPRSEQTTHLVSVSVDGSEKGEKRCGARLEAGRTCKRVDGLRMQRNAAPVAERAEIEEDDMEDIMARLQSVTASSDTSLLSAIRSALHRVLELMLGSRREGRATQGVARRNAVETILFLIDWLQLVRCARVCGRWGRVGASRLLPCRPGISARAGARNIPLAVGPHAQPVSGIASRPAV